jgi:hypothetical protein
VESGEAFACIEWAADVVKESGSTWYALNVGMSFEI